MTATDILKAANVDVPEAVEDLITFLGYEGEANLKYQWESWAEQMHDEIVPALEALAREVVKWKQMVLDLVEAAFNCVDPDDAEEIVQEAFPHGVPPCVVRWYHDHPSDQEAKP